MAQNKPVKFKLRVDIQCSVCGSLTHASEGPLPRFCLCCGAAMERFCLHCRRKAEMFFEEWWPEDCECVRTYSPARRCPQCNAVLAVEGENNPGQDYAH